MYRQFSFILLFLIIQVFHSSGQVEKRLIYASRINTEPEIDGIEDNEVWNAVESYDGFIQFEPYNASKPSQTSRVKFAYSDNAFFVYAYLYDTKPDSIIHGLIKRDQVSNSHSDVFMISIDPFNDGVYAYEFVVSASGVQEDRRVSPDGNSLNWDAVWESAVSINKDGWAVEIKIPFSALRFPNNDVQIWGLNVWRHIRRNREWSSLNYVDNKVEGSINQAAELHGINGVKPSIRLAMYPYLSAYAEKNPDHKAISYSFNYGADLKYGINESFTLDLTLIPDFGQVESDDEILNLSPFEVRYNEKRQFFTESTELFNKGGVFYSRRIGGMPVDYSGISQYLNEGETIKSNPDRTNIINAVKISGRTKKGLGIGVLNAMTTASNAIIVDSLGNERNVQTQGFTNYNILVLDQTLKNNSYVSLINTLTKRNNLTADVIGTVFNFRNKKNSYALNGVFLFSQRLKIDDRLRTGVKYDLSFSKTAGNFRFSIYESVESDTYNPNDLGYLQANNAVNHGFRLNYNVFEPFWRVHFWSNSFSLSHHMLYKPNEFTSLNFNFNSRTRFRNHLSTGFSLDGTPINSYDYYESRIDGQKFMKPPYFRFDTWISPDYRKPFAVDVSVAYRHTWLYNMNAISIRVSPRIRFNDKLMLILSTRYYILINDRGFATLISDTIEGSLSIFGRRDNMTLNNSINLDYIFNNKSSLSFRLRHYWSTADYHEFYTLNQDGALESNNYSQNHDISYNAFTIDMVYTWQFAPGSELSVVWKNAIFTSENQILPSYADDLKEVFNAGATNSISLKVLYYLDYHYLTKLRK